MYNHNFIITYDKDIGKKLMELGFKNIQNKNVDIFVFVNDSSLSFTNDIDMSKIKYSNKLFF